MEKLCVSNYSHFSDNVSAVWAEVDISCHVPLEKGQGPSGNK